MAAPSAVEVPAEDFSRIYMDDIISRASDRAVTSASAALESISGHMPIADRQSTARAIGIISPVRGIAIRFVRRKCVGKVPKYIYASGPVVI